MKERVLVRAGSSGQPPSPPSGMADIGGCLGSQIGAIDYRRASRCDSGAGRVILLKTLMLAIDPQEVPPRFVDSAFADTSFAEHSSLPNASTTWDG